MDLGLTEDAARKLIKEAREEWKEEAFKRASDLMKETRKRYSTGIKALDEALEGGLETKAITEISGEAGTGKTQFCMTFATLLEGKALYIDTEQTFKPSRVAQIAKARGLNSDAVLNNLIYARAISSEHQTALLDMAHEIIKTNGLKAVIVDSAIAHFRAEYTGREMLAARQQALNRFLRKLLKLAQAYDLVALITNQIEANPQPFQTPWKPAGGNIMGHNPQLRIFLREAAKGKRVAKIIKSCWLPENEILFQITERGVEDAS